MWAVPKKTFLSFVAALFTSVLVGGLFLPTQASALDVSSTLTSTPILFAEEAVETDQVDCQGGGMSWLFCGLIEGFAAAADFLINFFIVPFLQTTPIDLSNPNNTVFQIWSSVRVIASVIMVIVLFALVIGQAVGNDYASAYAVKKTLPRLLVALVLMNISIYIVAGLVDIFNIIGMSIGQLMMSPFADSGNVVFEIGSGASSIITIAGIAGGVWAATAVSVAGLQLVMLTVLLPLLLAIVAVFATLVIRQGLILLLIIVAPIAFALYALPNTEQYFQKWWSLFIKTLIVFPIVVAVLTLSNIMVIVNTAANQGSAVAGPITGLVGLVLMALPLFIIPFAFQLAGGIIGTIATKGAGFGKSFASKVQGDPRDQNSRIARLRSNARDGAVKNRSGKVGSLSEIAAGRNDKSRFGKSRLSRGLADRSARILNYGDLESQRSRLNKEEGDLRDLKTGYGPDTSVRALFATKQKDGTYRSIITGKKFSAGEHAKARQLYGSNLSSTQAALDYELGKTGNSEEYNAYKKNIPAFLNGNFKDTRDGAVEGGQGLGYSESEISEILIGVQYKNAGKRIDLKHTKPKKDEKTGEWSMKRSHAAFTQDVSENLGSYPLSNQKVDTINALKESYEKAHAAKISGDLGDFGSMAEVDQVLTDTSKIVNSIDPTNRRGGQIGVGDNDQPIAASGGTGAAGRVDQAIGEYIKSFRDNNPTPPPQNPPAGPPPGP